MYDGKEFEGRPISSLAYAAYLRGAYLETQGQYAAAVKAYRSALNYDDDSPEIQTRIAKLSCLSGSDEADTEFSNAISADANYEPAWREWARCALRRGQIGQALRFAKRAQNTAPSSLEATLVLVDVLQAQDAPDAAKRQLLGFVTRYPEDPQAWQSLLEFAMAHADSAWKRQAQLQLERLQFPSQLWPRAPKLPRKPVDPTSPDADFQDQLEDIQRALRDGELQRARSLSTNIRLSPARLAALALANQRYAIAIEQARFVLRANPNDGDARTVGLLAAHELGDQQAFEQLLQLDGATPILRSEHSATLFRRLLHELEGQQVAELWQASRSAEPVERRSSESAEPEATEPEATRPAPVEAEPALPVPESGSPN